MKIRKNVNGILVILVWPHPHPVGKSMHLTVNSGVGEVHVSQRKLRYIQITYFMSV